MTQTLITTRNAEKMRKCIPEINTHMNHELQLKHVE